MRVLILGMNYAPESTGIGPYTTEFAEYLAQSGHEVHVITARPHFPQWKIWSEYRGRARRSEQINGVHIRRTYAYVPDKPRKVLNRILYDSVFSFAVLLRGIFMRRCNIVLAVSPPVQLGLTGWLVAKRHRAKLFFHIKDIVSLAMVGAGMVGHTSLMNSLAKKVEDLAYRCADSIGVICDAFDRYLRNVGVAPSKIVFFPDYIDSKVLAPTPRFGDFRKRHNIAEHDFLVMYSGGIAQKQGLDTLVQAARLTPQFRIFIIGEGPTKADLEQKAADYRLTNVTFLPLQPKSQIGQQLSAADVLVLTQKESIGDAVFPSKLLTYMACGRPIVAAAGEDSETARFMNRYKVGIVVSPEDPVALSQALAEVANNPERMEELVQNAIRTVSEKFERDAVLARMSEMLTTAEFAAATK